MAERKKALTHARKKMDAAIAGVATVTDALSAAVGDEQFSPMDTAVNATMAELLQLLHAADTSLTAAAADPELPLAEDPSLWSRVAANVKTAKTHIQALAPAPKAKAAAA
eukprot:9238774-Heterocapsa_arctica.AAC.1